jgi:hypothetical protein
MPICEPLDLGEDAALDIGARELVLHRLGAGTGRAARGLAGRAGTLNTTMIASPTNLLM